MKIYTRKATQMIGIIHHHSREICELWGDGPGHFNKLQIDEERTSYRSFNLISSSYTFT